jgi:hypothetical protein
MQKMIGQIVQLKFGFAYPSMLEGDNDLLLEPGDGLEGFRFAETSEMGSQDLSAWTESHFSCVLDGDLDDPSVFKSISVYGAERFGTNDAYYDEGRGLVLSDIVIYLIVNPEVGKELSDEAMDDLFHTIVLEVKDSSVTMSFTEFEDYEAAVVDEAPERLIRAGSSQP